MSKPLLQIGQLEQKDPNKVMALTIADLQEICDDADLLVLRGLDATDEIGAVVIYAEGQLAGRLVAFLQKLGVEPISSAAREAEA